MATTTWRFDGKGGGGGEWGGPGGRGGRRGGAGDVPVLGTSGKIGVSVGDPPPWSMCVGACDLKARKLMHAHFKHANACTRPLAASELVRKPSRG
eukprot:103597-Chlamydomonas_euryale.AAC.4